MDSKNFVIGVLSTTAVILLVGILIINTRPQSAWADGMTLSARDYVMTVGSVTKGDEEVLYMIDAPQQKLIIYRFDTNRKLIDIVQGIDLVEMRDTTQTPQQQQPRSGRGGRGRP